MFKNKRRNILSIELTNLDNRHVSLIIYTKNFIIGICIGCCTIIIVYELLYRLKRQSPKSQSDGVLHQKCKDKNKSRECLNLNNSIKKSFTKTTKMTGMVYKRTNSPEDYSLNFDNLCQSIRFIDESSQDSVSQQAICIFNRMETDLLPLKNIEMVKYYHKELLHPI